MNAGRHRDTILIVSFVTWCVLLTFPLLTVAGDALRPDSPLMLFQILGAAQYLVVAATVGRFGELIGRYDNFQISVIVIIYLSFGLQLHDDEGLIMAGIAYTIALMITIASLSLIFTMPAAAVAKCLGGAAAVFFAFGVSAIITFGWPQDRHLGPIHPNFFGSVMLSGFIFSQFREGAFFWLVRITCFALAAAVSTRFALIGCVLGLIVFEFTFNPFSLKLLLIFVLAAACFVVFNQQIVAILALDDPTRNLDSGFTGRDEEWFAAFKAIAEYPFGMGFKRPPFEGGWGHNGYLKTFLEFGVVGGSLIILAVLGIILRAMFEAIAGFREDSRLRRLSSARAAGLVALSFATFFQPQMFNLGDLHGISFMLLLFSLGRPPARQPRLHRREAAYDDRRARARFSSPGDQT